MKLSNRFRQDHIIRVAATGVIFLLLIRERGLAHGTQAMAALLYAGSVMWLGAIAIRAITLRRLVLTNFDWLSVAFSIGYACLSLVYSWPGLGILSALGLSAMAIIWLAVRFFSDRQ